MARRRSSITTTLKQRIPKRGRLLIGVSGGIDSCVLLDALIRVRALLEIELHVCHIDHGLRSSSKNDAEFVRARCAHYKVPCYVIGLGKLPARTNMEAWAREERYRAFKRVIVEHQLDWVLTAHTANDVAETLIMRLLANKELNSIDLQDNQRRCLRPLLDISRQQVEEYAERHKVPWTEDPTNSDTTLLRNRVRHTLIPALARDFDPSVVWSLSERAQALALDCEALQGVAEGLASTIGAIRDGDLAWLERCTVFLRQQPHALQWRTVQVLLTPLLGFSVGERVAVVGLSLLLGEQLSVELGGGCTISRDRTGLKSSRLSRS